MAMEKALDNILDMPSKVKILRVFASRREDYIATGREVARLAGISPPAAHAALKELYNQDVLRMDIVGRQHLYRLNAGSRNVKNILLPAFRREVSVRKDIYAFLKEKIKFYKVEGSILSLVIYGSFQKRSPDEANDIDVAVIIKNNSSLRKIENVFINKISSEFHDYFGAHLDAYIKKKQEFLKLLDENLPPVSTLIKSYDVIYGKDPMEVK